MAARRARTTTKKAAPSAMIEIGTSGLNRQGGQVYEEFLPALQGRKAVQVYREMRDNDPVVGAMLRAIDMLIRGVDWRVEPATDSPADVQIAEFVDSCIRDMDVTWADTLADILSFIPFGFAVREEVYKRRAGPTDQPSTSSQHDDGRIGWSAIAPRAQETIEQWKWDEAGRLIGCVQIAPPDFRTREIPISRFLLFRTSTEKGNPEGKSVLRTAYRPWYFKKRIEEIEGIGIERDLAGLPTALVPPALLAPGAAPEHKATITQIAEILRNIRRDQKEGIIFPLAYDEQGKLTYELKLLSTGGRRQFDTSQIIQRYDTRIAMSVLADFVLLGHEKVGSFALASSKTNLFAVALGAWLDSIAETFNRFAIPRLLRMNTFTWKVAPKLMHGDVEAVDLNELSQYVSSLVGVGVLTPEPSLERHMRSNAGLPELTEEDLERMAEEREAKALEIARATKPAPGDPEEDPEDPDPDDEPEDDPEDEE